MNLEQAKKAVDMLSTYLGHKIVWHEDWKEIAGMLAAAGVFEDSDPNVSPEIFLKIKSTQFGDFEVSGIADLALVTDDEYYVYVIFPYVGTAQISK